MKNLRSLDLFFHAPYETWEFENYEKPPFYGLLPTRKPVTRHDNRRLTSNSRIWIMKARESGNNSLRKFVLPEIRMEASSFHSIIDWQRFNRSEPPLTMDVSSECLQLLATTGDKITALPDLSNHMQAIERMIKLVTATSSSRDLVVGHEERERLIRSRIEDRKRLPKFNTKKNSHSMLQH